MVWIVACSRHSELQAGTLQKASSEPEIKCGAIYVTDSDKTKHVTKNIVAQTAAPEDKKKRSSKYSLAIGSSFGHVHTFLKDSDHVLKALENTKVEDKCLMLIRKPKSSSKQMLKAHSWANLSATDMHLRRPDGSMKPNQNPLTQHKLRSGDFTLPRDQHSKWQHQPSNHTSPNKGLSNHSSSFKELSTVVEQSQENTTTQVPSRQHRHSDVENGNFMSYSEQNSNLRNFGRAVSSIDLRQTDSEINNNNRMGGAFNKSRPKGPPPPVPTKTFKNNKTQAKQDQNRSPQETQVYCVDNDPRKLAMSNNRPDIISNVHDKGSMPSDRTKKGNVHISHAKSDSGFCSDTRISSDEMYDYGFKQELEMNNHMTSSPRSKGEKGYSDQWPTDKRVVNNKNTQNTQSKMRPEPQSYTNRNVLYEKNTNITKQQVEKGRSKSDSVDRYHSKEQFIQNGLSKRKENLSQSDPRSNYARNDKSHSHIIHKHTNSPFNAPPKPERSADRVKQQQQQRQQQQHQQQQQQQQQQQRHPQSPYQQQTESRHNQHHKQPTPNNRPTNDYNRQKSHEQRPSPMKDDQVFRAQSMGDLSTGCAFSLVGQKRDENIDEVNNVGLTGSQLAEHFRKYRKIKQESKHGSLPFRGKTVDDADIRTRLDEVQYNQPPSYQKVKAQKALHYGSLQHLPMSSEGNNSEQRHILPTKFREKTPMKPRRSLPQVPGDVDEKKKQLSEAVITRICASRNSSSSPSSGGSNRASEVRIGGGISATPSDREVSVLLGHNQNEIVVVPPKHKTNWCNNTSSDSIHGQILPPDSYYNTNHHHSLGASDSYGHHEQNSSSFTAPSGGRLSESGQTTLTSQSTIDSGYITNDPDLDPLSTSNYAKSVKQSAQNLYTSNKMFKSPKGEHSQVFMQNLNKGGNSSSSKEKVSSSKHGKETHTRNWLEKHPGSYMGDTLKLGLNISENQDTQRGLSDKLDTNNNKDPKYAVKTVTELDLTDKSRQKEQSSRSHTLIHHLSDPSGKESEKSVGGDIGQFRNKGMSISMSQGLNMIEKNSKANSGSFLSKSQPKFTGSLKDLLGADKQIVPIEALKMDNPQLNSTLPINFKFQHKPETSLKLLGKPSLFQLLQNYNLYAVRMNIPEGFNILDNMRMIECEVVLPSLWLHSTESQLSPQGNYAKLGGPFSAFRPVSNQSSQIKSVSMVTVMDLTNQLSGCFEMGSIIKGDLVIELNERLMVGESLTSINTLLQGCHGEMLWTIARDKAREGLQDRKSSSPTNEDFHRMKDTITDLTSELRKKDRALKQLNALLPWKQNEKKEGDTKEQDPYICTLSDDEFIV